MINQEIVDGLTFLGFTSNYAIGGDPAKIILWENPESQPTDAEIQTASVQGKINREKLAIEQSRKAAYQQTADPLYFGWQRGENTEQEWLDAVQAVKEQYPYPDGV